MIKRSYFVFVLAFFAYTAAISQVDFKVGLNLGGQISSLRGFDFVPNANFKLVPMVGLNVELSVSQRLSIVTGINFERWKLKRDFSYFDEFGRNLGGENTDAYDFFNVPFLIRYRFGNNKNFFIEGGAFMNYFNKGRPNGLLPLFIVFEEYNFGPTFGVGKIFRLNERLDIALQLRNEFGISNVNKFENWVSGSNVRSNTTRLIATLSYKL